MPKPEGLNSPLRRAHERLLRRLITFEQRPALIQLGFSSFETRCGPARFTERPVRVYHVQFWHWFCYKDSFCPERAYASPRCWQETAQKHAHSGLLFCSDFTQTGEDELSIMAQVRCSCLLLVKHNLRHGTTAIISHAIMQVIGVEVSQH